MTDSRDKANGDLKPGDKVMIREWVKQKAFVKQRMGAMGITTETIAEQEAGDDTIRVSPNVRFFGDVIEILAVDYPWAVVDIHTVNGSCDYNRARFTFNLTEFECEKASAEYVRAVMSGAPKPPPIPEPAPPAQNIVVANVHITGLDNIARAMLAGAVISLILWSLWTFR